MKNLTRKNLQVVIDLHPDPVIAAEARTALYERIAHDDLIDCIREGQRHFRALVEAELSTKH